MREFIFGNQYHAICIKIQARTEEFEADMADLDEVCIASSIGDGTHNSEISKPTENKAMLNIPLRNRIEAIAQNELDELYDKKLDMKEIIKSANLTEDEQRIFYLYYSGKKSTQEEIAKKIYSTREGVNLKLKSLQEKINKIL